MLTDTVQLTGVVAANTGIRSDVASRVAQPEFGSAWLHEYGDILGVRLRALQHHGHLPELTTDDLASPFDLNARHLVCRVDGTVVGYVRLIIVNQDPRRSQYASCGHLVPDWLWREGFIEAGAGAIEPAYQKAGLWIRLLTHAIQEVGRMGYRLMLGASDDHLLPVYIRMGFTEIESRNVEPMPGWKFRSNLIAIRPSELVMKSPADRECRQ